MSHHQAHPHDLSHRNVAGFYLPLINSGRGRTLTTGRGVSVYYDHQPKYVWREHVHDVLQILISVDPVDMIASWNLRGEQHRHGVTGRFIWVLPEGTPHAKEWCGEAGMVVLYVEKSFVRAVCGTDVTTAVLADFSTLARFDLIVWQLIGEFRRLCRHEHSASPILVESMGTLLAASVLRHLGRLNESAAPSLSTAKLRDVLDHIDAHLAETITRAALAKIARLSIRSFGRQFKVRTGLTPRDYIRRRRTVRAMELIEEGLLTKAAIATDVGFCDQSHMKKQILRLRAEEVAAARLALRGEK